MFSSIRKQSRRRARLTACTGVLVAAVLGAGASTASAAPIADGLTTANPNGTMQDYMTDVVTDVGSFWTTQLTAAGKTAPFAYYHWLNPGESVQMGCTDSLGNPFSSDSTAAYCSTDDTIYFSTAMAQQIADGTVGELATTAGGTSGDFSVAYAIAHEYAHDVQNDLGIYANNQNLSTKQFELQADCMAGVWANSAYWKGRLQAGDVEEAVNATRALGDLDYGSPDHHGTAEERSAAFMLGYNTGDAGRCSLDLGDADPEDSYGSVIFVG